MRRSSSFARALSVVVLLAPSALAAQRVPAPMAASRAGSASSDDRLLPPPPARAGDAPRHRGRTILLGALGGTGIGAAIGHHFDRRNVDSRGEGMFSGRFVPANTVLFGLAGGLVGGITANVVERRRTRAAAFAAYQRRDGGTP